MSIRYQGEERLEVWEERKASMVDRISFTSGGKLKRKEKRRRIRGTRGERVSD